MTYSIGQAAKRAGLTIHTLRYYDKEGLLPFVERTPSGTRYFKENDFEWLHVITCLKKTGMPLKEIRRYIDLGMKGDGTLRERLDMIRNQRVVAEKQMEDIQRCLDKIDYKIRYYETAIETGCTGFLKKPGRCGGEEEVTADEKEAV